MKNATGRGLVSLFRSSVSTLIYNKEVLFPFSVILFIQLLFLEILYFSPRFPLNVFFTPIITHYLDEIYLHYPHNLLIIPRLFHNHWIQGLIYIFISSFFFGLGIAIIKRLNGGHKVLLKPLLKELLPMYVHICVAAMVIFGVIKLLFYSNGLLVQRVMLIEKGGVFFYYLKKLVLEGATIINFLITIFVTALFAYVIPLIVCEKKKVFTAFLVNFKILYKSFFYTFMYVLIPSLFYLPVLILRNSIAATSVIPEARLYILILSLCVSVIIDAIIYTSIATYYLYKVEDQ